MITRIHEVIHCTCMYKIGFVGVVLISTRRIYANGRLEVGMGQGLYGISVSVSTGRMRGVWYVQLMRHWWYYFILAWHVHVLLPLQYGQAPLMLASLQGNVECLQLLLDRGAQLNHQNQVNAV